MSPAATHSRTWSVRRFLPHSYSSSSSSSSLKLASIRDIEPMIHGLRRTRSTDTRGTTPTAGIVRRTTPPCTCTVREWARGNPELARRCLDLPPPPTATPTPTPAPTQQPLDDGDCAERSLSRRSPLAAADTLERYLELRGWRVPNDDLTNEENTTRRRNNAVSLISHPLSYPLTLAQHVSVWFSTNAGGVGSSTEDKEEEDEYDYDDDDVGDGKKRIPPNNDQRIQKVHRIACLGARSEATLPNQYWREFLLYLSSSRSELREQLPTPQPCWRIDFIGPDVPTNGEPKHISYDDDLEGDETNDDDDRPHLELNFHKGYLEDLLGVVGTERNQPRPPTWDGLVLFNPGIGHPNLRTQWEDTVVRIFSATELASCPILFTAHSASDAKRDLEAIRVIAIRERERARLRSSNGEEAATTTTTTTSGPCPWDVLCQILSSEQPDDGAIENGYVVGRFIPNIYASRLEYDDPFEPGHVVTPNHSTLVIPPRAFG